jgi:hypothetical protein
VDIIFMRLRIAKIDQETITEELGDMTVIAVDDVRADLLIRTDHVPILFRVELGGQLRRIDQVAEQHGQLPAFGVWRMTFSRGWFALGRGLFLERRLWLRLVGLRGWCGDCFGVPSPGEASVIGLHSQYMGVE